MSRSDLKDILPGDQVIIEPFRKDRVKMPGACCEPGLILSINVEWAVDSSIGVATVRLRVLENPDAAPRPEIVICEYESDGEQRGRLGF